MGANNRITGGTENKSLETDENKVGRVVLKKCEIKARRRSCIGNSGTGQNVVEKNLLHPMRLDVPAGSITAILGTMESGESTLLKFIAGCLDNDNLECEGVVNLPGTRAYLPEETSLHRFYTPRTYIKHYDKLLNFSLSKKYGNIQSPYRCMSDEDIDRLLDTLRISIDRRDSVVGDIFRRGLTMSEQRRLELGLLVLASPDTNPIEGLDSITSLHVMEFLKGYTSNASRRVIITLNRTSNFIWNLIDNVILLSRGRVVFEGKRVDMEAFFAHHKAPTPKGFSPIEHYLAVVNNFGRLSANDWETNFKIWQENVDCRHGDTLAIDMVETCFPSVIPNIVIPQVMPNNCDNESTAVITFGANVRIGNIKYFSLVRRYLLQMLLNPGILQIRLAMYTMLSLFLGALFFNLEKDYQDRQSIDSHAALLFYSSSFYIFMVCAVLPFLAMDLQIRDKEVLNGFYHPITHHLAVAVCTIPACLILSLVISVIQVNMVGLQNGMQFFLILSLALWCSDALAMLVSLCAPHFVIGIVVCAGICGFFMALEGFMLVPSKFPKWLGWTYPVPFHTYVFRSLMFNEFQGDPFGSDVLRSYEIEDTSISQDQLVLFCYGLVSFKLQTIFQHNVVSNKILNLISHDHEDDSLSLCN